MAFVDACSFYLDAGEASKGETSACWQDTKLDDVASRRKGRSSSPPFCHLSGNLREVFSATPSPQARTINPESRKTLLHLRSSTPHTHPTTVREPAHSHLRNRPAQQSSSSPSAHTTTNAAAVPPNCLRQQRQTNQDPAPTDRRRPGVVGAYADARQ